MTLKEMEAERERILAEVRGDGSVATLDDAGRPMRKTEYTTSADLTTDPALMGPRQLIMRKSADVPENLRPLHKTLCDLNDGALFAKARFGTKPQDQEWFREELHNLRKSDARLAKAMDMEKAMDTAEAGGGLEWVPSQPSAEFFAIYSAALRVAPLFGEPIQMKAQVIPFPTLSARPTLVAGSEQTADQGSKVTSVQPTTASRSFTAKKINGRTPFSDEIEEDAIFPWVPFYRQQLAIALARAEESAYLDGDTTNPHQDNDIAAGGTDVRVLFRGLRKHALANAATVDALGTTAGFTAASMRAARAKLGADYSLAPVDDLVYICGAQVASNRVIGLGNDIKPPGAHPLGLVYVPGEIGRFDGIRVIGSPVARETLNAVGVHDLTTQNTGYVLLVYTPAWKKGVRKPANLRMFEDVIYEQKHLVISYRGAFDTFWTAENTVAIIYNCKTTA